MIPTTCSRLRLGGTVSGSTITGGTSIQNDRMFAITYAGLLGHPGRRGANVSVPYLDGQLRRARKRSLPRTITLTVEVMDRNALGGITTSRGVQWEANMDLLMQLVDGLGESVILERDMADATTRFLECEVIAPFQFIDGLRNSSHVSYIGAMQLECHHPYWQSEVQTTTAIGTTFTPGGNATLFNQIFSFATAGNVVHSQTADSITVSAGSFPILVDCGKRTVTLSGADASNRVTLNSASWMRFPSGTSATFTATATGSVLHRAQFL